LILFYIRNGLIAINKKDHQPPSWRPMVELAQLWKKLKVLVRFTRQPCLGTSIFN